MIIAVTKRIFLFALASAGLTTFATIALASGVTATFTSGPLKVNAPAASLDCIPSASDASTLNASFTVGVVDATGTRAGWHLHLNLGVLSSDDGTNIPIAAATVLQATIIPQTGLAPSSTWAYPLPLDPQGDTAFGAAVGTGAGISSIRFDVQMTVPTAVAVSARYTCPLTVAIIGGS